MFTGYVCFLFIRKEIGELTRIIKRLHIALWPGDLHGAREFVWNYIRHVQVEVCRIFGSSPKYNSKKWTMWWRIPNLFDETHRWKHYTIQQTELLQMNRIWCVVASVDYDSWVSPTSGRGWPPDWQLYMTIY